MTGVCKIPSPPPALGCPDKDTLQHFLTGLLSEAEAESVERHLEGCPSCLDCLGELSAHDRRLCAVRGWGSELGTADEPETVTALIRACQAGRGRSGQAEALAGPSTLKPLDTPLAELPAVRREPPSAPARFGRYRVLRSLGAGGMGAVYLADDPELGRTVAVKVPQFAGPPEAQATARQRFLRESRAAAAIRHPRVCPIYDVGEQDGIPYVIMAFIDGCSLAERLKREGRIADARAALAVAVQVAEGLAAVHDAGLIHRDLKPANVLLDAAGDAFLSDFGLARRHDDADRLTVFGALVGTPAYMAPEQADTKGGFGPLTPRSDLYSLGVVLYELLIGRRPFQAESDASLLYQIVHETPPPPRQLRTDLDPSLEAIVLKAIARQPQERYASARDMAAALAGYVQAPPQPAAAAPAADHDTPPAAPPQRPRPRKLWKAAAGAGVAASLLLGVVLYVTHGDNNTPEAADLPAVAQALIRNLSDADASVRLTAATGLASHKHPAAVEALGQALSDKDPRVLRAAAHSLREQGDKAAVPYLMKRLADDVWGKTSRTAQLLRPGSGIEPPPFENWEKGPNQGTRYAALEALQELAPEKVTEALLAAKKSTNVDVQKWAIRELGKLAQQGQPAKSPKPGTEIIKDHTNTVRAVAFSPDGKLLATAGDDKSIRILDVATGQRKPRIPHDAGVHCLAFSPDGATLASGGADGAVTLWDVATWEKQRNMTDGDPGIVAGLAFAPDGRTLATVGSQKKIAILWDVDLGKPVASLEGHTDYVNAAAFSPDRQTLATVSDDGTVRLWDAATGQAKGRPLNAHDGAVHCLAFSPDGQKLATGGKDETILIWDVVTGQVIEPVLEVHGSVVFVGWTPDGRIVSKTYRDGVSLWNPAVNKPVVIRKKFDQPLVSIGKQYDADIALTPDGRILAFRDCYRTQDVHVLDLARRLDAPQ